MKNFALKSLTVLVASLVFSAQAFAAEDSSLAGDFLLSNLQDNQVLKIEYGYQGCFGGGNGQLEIKQGEVTYTSDRGNVHPSYTLTDADIESIDSHLAWIAVKGTDGGCTTSTSFELKLIEEGKTISRQKTSHDWCSYDTAYKADVPMDFKGLAYKIDKLNKTEVKP